MNLLLLGANGLIGRHLAPALRAAGCNVIGAGRQRPVSTAHNAWRAIDFASMDSAAAWLPMLAGVDAVINCVGIIRESREGAMEQVQHSAPVALFAACEQLGIRRVIQLSALGSAPDAATGFWRSKGAADANLLRRDLDATVLRMSLVYAADGASSVLLRALATLPVLALPMARRALVQPIHIDDLTDAVVKLVTSPHPVPGLLAAVGPRPLSMADYLAALRAGMQAGGAWVLEPPLPLARLAARAAALHPASTLTPDTLTMLTDRSRRGGNTADAGAISALLGRRPRDPAGFAQPAQRAGAVLGWAVPLLTIAFGVLWILTALVSWFGWPHQESRHWLAACAIPLALREPALLGASLLDGAIGAALLLRPRRWLWLGQLVLVGGYTIALSVCLPDLWLHPFGPLSKNLPLLAILCLLWRLTPKRT